MAAGFESPCATLFLANTLPLAFALSFVLCTPELRRKHLSLRPLGYTVQASEMRRIFCNVHSKESNKYVSAAVLCYQNLTIHTARAIITCASLLTLTAVQTMSKRERSSSACMCKAGQGVGENSGREEAPGRRQTPGGARHPTATLIGAQDSKRNTSRRR